MQKRMVHTHAAAFAPQQARTFAPRPGATMDKRLTCKFHKAGTCRETGESHTDPMTGIVYHHDIMPRRK